MIIIRHQLLNFIVFIGPTAYHQRERPTLDSIRGLIQACMGSSSSCSSRSARRAARALRCDNVIFTGVSLFGGNLKERKPRLLAWSLALVTDTYIDSKLGYSCITS